MRYLLLLSTLLWTHHAYSQVALPAGLPLTDVEPTWLPDTVIDLSVAEIGSWDAASSGNGIYDQTLWAVVYKFSSLTIPPNTTVRFANHPSGAPVVFLVGGDVEIGSGSLVTLDGENSTSGNFAQNSEPGPGGFRGGAGGTSGISGGPGFGPGGGVFGSCTCLNGNSGGNGTYDGVYGNSQLLPLIGGSGGSAQGTSSAFGGAGGGAILMVTEGVFRLDGQITARGGSRVQTYNYVGSGYDLFTGVGSGGGIRIICTRSEGSGQLDVRGGGSFGGSSLGRLRLEMHDVADSWTTFPVVNRVGPGSPPQIWPEASSPKAEILTVESVPIADPSADWTNPDAVITGQSSELMVTIQTTNVAASATVNVVVCPRQGQRFLVPCALVPGGTPPSLTWTATIGGVPDGFGVLQVTIEP